MLRLFFLSGLFLSFISACQTVSRSYDSPNSLPPAGTVIQLHQPLIVQQGTSRTYVQHGKALSSINQHAPWCQFSLYETYRAMQSERTILPDQFTVVKSYQWSDVVLSKPVIVASSNLVIGSFEDGGGPSSMTLSTVMKLKSEKQPHVAEMKCAIFDDPFDKNYLSVNQIKKTLGDVVTLHLNPATN